jgi:hypothetical protein
LALRASRFTTTRRDDDTTEDHGRLRRLAQRSTKLTKLTKEDQDSLRRTITRWRRRALRGAGVRVGPDRKPPGSFDKRFAIRPNPYSRNAGRNGRRRRQRAEPLILPGYFCDLCVLCALGDCAPKGAPSCLRVVVSSCRRLVVSAEGGAPKAP